MKVLTVLVVLVIIFEMTWIWSAGRQLASGGLNGKEHKNVLGRHRALVTCVGCLALVAVVLIEAQVRLSPDPYASGWALMAFHLFVNVFLVSIFLTMTLRFTGLRAPTVHRRLAHMFFVLLAISAITGGIMLYQLPVH